MAAVHKRVGAEIPAATDVEQNSKTPGSGKSHVNIEDPRLYMVIFQLDGKSFAPVSLSSASSTEIHVHAFHPFWVCKKGKDAERVDLIDEKTREKVHNIERAYKKNEITALFCDLPANSAPGSAPAILAPREPLTPNEKTYAVAVQNFAATQQALKSKPKPSGSEQKTPPPPQSPSQMPQVATRPRSVSQQQQREKSKPSTSPLTPGGFAQVVSQGDNTFPKPTSRQSPRSPSSPSKKSTGEMPGSPDPVVIKRKPANPPPSSSNPSQQPETSITPAVPPANASTPAAKPTEEDPESPLSAPGTAKHTSSAVARLLIKESIAAQAAQAAQPKKLKARTIKPSTTSISRTDLFVHTGSRRKPPAPKPENLPGTPHVVTIKKKTSNPSSPISPSQQPQKPTSPVTESQKPASPVTDSPSASVSTTSEFSGGQNRHPTSPTSAPAKPGRHTRTESLSPILLRNRTGKVHISSQGSPHPSDQTGELSPSSRHPGKSATTHLPKIQEVLNVGDQFPLSQAGDTSSTNLVEAREASNPLVREESFGALMEQFIENFGRRSSSATVPLRLSSSPALNRPLQTKGSQADSNMPVVTRARSVSSQGPNSPVRSPHGREPLRSDRSNQGNSPHQPDSGRSLKGGRSSNPSSPPPKHDTVRSGQGNSPHQPDSGKSRKSGQTSNPSSPLPKQDSGKSHNWQSNLRTSQPNELKTSDLNKETERRARRWHQQVRERTRASHVQTSPAQVLSVGDSKTKDTTSSISDRDVRRETAISKARKKLVSDEKDAKKAKQEKEDAIAAKMKRPKKRSDRKKAAEKAKEAASNRTRSVPPKRKGKGRKS